MNQITRAASDLAGGGMILAVLTVLFMAFFVGTAIWLYSRSNDRWDPVARLALDDNDGISTSDETRGR